WTALPGSSVTFIMRCTHPPSPAVTSLSLHDALPISADTVSPSTTPPPPPPCPTGWNCADVGSPALAGSQSLSAGTWTIQGGGAGIWDSSDQLRFAWQSLATDGGISARILSQSPTSGW